MRVRVGVLLLAGLVWLPGLVLAQGKGHGREKAVPPSLEDSGKRVVREAVDATVDELVGEQTQAGKPPGLAKKEALPPGLAKQGKTPPGWSKGKKEGWDGKKESPLRRLIRGIFRKPAPQTSPQQ